MQWSDVIAKPKARQLRQFAGLWLMFLTALAGWRAWHGDWGLRTDVTAALGLGLGLVGLVAPAAMRWVYTAAMVVAFPIGWVVSQLMLAAIFYLVFTPVALIFRAVGRDALGRRRHESGSHWQAKPASKSAGAYLRQS